VGAMRRPTYGSDLERDLQRSITKLRRAKRIERKKMSETTAIQRVSTQDADNLAAAVVVRGDLSGLNEGQLKAYYIDLCHSLGLNPLTRPFSLLTLNGKKMLYANRDCSDQLRKRDNVSVEIISRERADELIIVRTRATLPSGRVDESLGAVPCGATVKGENLANAMMKAETKAKRRVTLSICGLAFMDESEVDSTGATIEPLPQISATVTPGDTPDAPQDDDLAADLARILEQAKADCATCDSYEKAVALRAIIGSKAKQSDLTRRIQEAMENSAINANTHRELGKLWQHCHRQIEKLEKKLAPGPEASFKDQEREPGQDDEEETL